MKQYFVGVINRPPQTLIHDEESNITPEKYPQFKYVLGPYKDKETAELDVKSHVNKDGTFTDPFCNNGEGR
jgi:hypothetical protein